MSPLHIGGHVEQTDPIAEAVDRKATLSQFFLGDPQSYKGPVVSYAGGAAGELHDRPLVALRVAEEELAQRGPACGGLGHRVGLVDVPTDAQLHDPHRTCRHRRRGRSRPVAG